MPSPQCEDGYTRIANELLDAMWSIRVPGEAMQVFLFIMRKTYGFNKKEDMIPLSQFTATGISKPHIVRAIKTLGEMNMIVAEKGNKVMTTYRINKKYSQWKPLPKKAMLPKKETGVAEKGNEPLPKKEPSKDNTKDTIQKTLDKDQQRVHDTVEELRPDLLGYGFTQQEIDINRDMIIDRIGKHQIRPGPDIKNFIRGCFKQELRRVGNGSGNDRNRGSAKAIDGKAEGVGTRSTPGARCGNTAVDYSRLPDGSANW